MDLCLWFTKTKQYEEYKIKKMNNNLKNALVVVGLAVGAFLLLSWTKKTQQAPKQLTDAEKDALFEAATTYYRGGAAPPIEVEQEFQRTRDEAMSKIKAMGLEKELADYLAKKQAEAEERERLYGPEPIPNMSAPMGL